MEGVHIPPKGWYQLTGSHCVRTEDVHRQYTVREGPELQAPHGAAVTIIPLLLA